MHVQDQFRDSVQLPSGTFGHINHVGVVIEVFGHGIATTVLTLAETVELYLRLMIGDGGVIDASYSIALLLNRVDQAEGVAGILEVIKVGLVSDLASDVIFS